MIGHITKTCETDILNGTTDLFEIIKKFVYLITFASNLIQ